MSQKKPQQKQVKKAPKEKAASQQPTREAKEIASKNSTTTIKPHSCRSTFQDRIYGVGLRLWNVSGKNPQKIRCTVCGITQG